MEARTKQVIDHNIKIVMATVLVPQSIFDPAPNHQVAFLWLWET
jgi:hypothetical protein